VRAWKKKDNINLAAKHAFVDKNTAAALRLKHTQKQQTQTPRK
jgi:hypothetical protein